MKPVDRNARRETLLTDLARRARKQKERMGTVRFFLKGSLVERYMTCGNVGCACHGKRSARHGPYLQWTRKLGGKTEAVWVPKELRELVEEWMETGERVGEGVTGWEEISVEALKRLCRDVRKTPPAKSRSPSR